MQSRSIGSDSIGEMDSMEIMEPDTIRAFPRHGTPSDDVRVRRALLAPTRAGTCFSRLNLMQQEIELNEIK